jgi:predicted ATPase
VLLGTNASGKSNIRDAFRFLHGLSRGYKLVEVFAGKHEGGDQIWSGIRGGPFEFIRQGEQDGYVLILRDKFRYAIILKGVRGKPPRVQTEVLNALDIELYSTGQKYGKRSTYTTANFVRVNLKAGGDYRKSQTEDLLTDEAILTQIPAFYRNRTDENMKMIQEGVSAVTDAFAQMRFLDLFPNAMREPSYPGQNTLGDRGENLSSVLQYIIEEKGKGSDLVEWLLALTPMDVADIAFEKDGRGRISLVLVEKNKRKTSVQSASDGTLRFLAYLALAFSIASPTMCFVEEIDNGIHPSRLSLLVELLETQSKHGNLQIIATSHSPMLLNLLSEETLSNALLVYRAENSQYSNVKPLKDLPGFREIAEKRRPGALMESGWFENTVEALEFDVKESGAA